MDALYEWHDSLAESCVEKINAYLYIFQFF